MPAPIPPHAEWPNCPAQARELLLLEYRLAHRYARAAAGLLDRIADWPECKRGAFWNRAVGRAAPVRWFGSYEPRRFQAVRSVFRAVLRRFESGYPVEGGRQPVRFLCLAPDQERCDSGVLANAREFATIRVCPRLLRKPPAAGATVILHEILHQGLGVGDQRHPVCKRGKETRCYREGATELVRHGILQLALRNTDNYAYFAAAVYAAGRRPHPATDRRSGSWT